MRRDHMARRGVALCAALLACAATAAETPSSEVLPVPTVSAAPAAPPSSPLDPAAASTAAAGAPGRVRFVATIGYDYGFEDLLKVHYEGGGSDRLSSNGGYIVALGASVPLPVDAPLDLRASAGFKYDKVSGSNGSAYFLGFPLELMLGVEVKPVRVSGGASLLVAPRVHGDGVLSDVNGRLRNSLGLVGQLEVMLPFRRGGGAVAVGARYTWQKLQASSGGVAVDATAIGIVASVIL